MSGNICTYNTDDSGCKTNRNLKVAEHGLRRDLSMKWLEAEH